MTEAENQGVYEEIAPPEADEISEAQVETEVKKVVEVQETDADRNFRRLRETNEQLQKEREQDRQMMMAMQREILKRNEESAPAPVPEVDEFADVDPSDWTTFEQAKKVAEKIADQRARKIIEEYEAKRHKDDLPNRIKNKFSDFNSVVNAESIKQLRAQEPDVANALSLIGDEEARAVAAYKYMKAFAPQVVESQASKQRIQENANSPKSLSSVGATSPLSQAGAFEAGFTPALQKQLWAEMNACARQS